MDQGPLRRNINAKILLIFLIMEASCMLSENLFHL